MKSSRRWLWLAVALAAAVALAVAGPLRSYVFQSNLHAVIPGEVYRSAQPSEADIDQQVSILEDTVSRGPAGIVISSTSSEATV